MTDGDWKQVQREIMCRDIPERTTPLAEAGKDFIYLSLWSRPGLDRRDRRWVTMACCAAADVPGASSAHVYAALESGDITIDEMLEFSLHFAVYCGWPRATNLEAVIMEQWRRIHEERGEPAPQFTPHANETLGPNDADERTARGIAEFNEVNSHRPRHPTRRTATPASWTSCSATFGSGPGCRDATAGSSPFPALAPATPRCRSSRRSRRLCTPATSRRTRWTR